MPAKVLLVEDDNNLREIYQARLMAEGYTIVTARDGEEALGVAKGEMPDLIISDVMMPRVSGFEMLDILRNTEGLKDTKVIMLTALGQADDKTRANSLGADRYLVKSQVTLEDIVKTSHELLEGMPAATPAASAPAEPTAPSDPMVPAVPQPEPMAVSPIAVASEPVIAAALPTEPVAPPMPAASAPTAAEEQANITAQIQQFVTSSPVTTPAATPSPTAVQDDAVLASAVQDLTANAPTSTATTPVPEPPVMPAPSQPVTAPAADAPLSDSVPIANKKIIQPLSSDGPKAPIHEILAREEAAGMHGDPVLPPAPATTFSPSVPGSSPTPPIGAVVSMPAAAPQSVADPEPAPAAQPAPTDPNSIAL